MAKVPQINLKNQLNPWSFGKLKKLLPLLVILLLNLLAIFIFGAVTVYHVIYPVKEEAVTISVVPPPVPAKAPEPMPEAGGGTAALDPQPQVVPPPSVAAVPIVSVTAPPTINFQNLLANHVNHTTPSLQLPPQGSSLVGKNSDGKKLGDGEVFGSFDGTGTALAGYLYDFKQTRNRDKIVMNPGLYGDAVRQFVKQGFDDALLHKYYKSPKALGLTRVAITPRPSNEAPKAFQVERDVRPACWLAYYQGQILPPGNGTYRFVGFGDDLLVVAINDEVVLDAGIIPVLDQNRQGRAENNAPVFPAIWTPRYKINANANFGRLRIGKAFTVTANTPVNIKILLGDTGGDCTFFLLLRNMDQTYTKEADGTMDLPLFQLSKDKTDLTGEFPTIGQDPEIWNAGH